MLEIKSEAMSYFKRKKCLPNFKIISEDEDKIVLSTEVAYDDEISCAWSSTGYHLSR